jgi:ABC-type transport system substrate-binding protein
VIRTKLGGRAVLAPGLLPTSSCAHRADVPTYRHDPDRARALLDEADYPDPDGPGGRPRLRLVYKTSSDRFRVALARIWAAQLGEVGIEVEVQSFEPGTFFEDPNAPRDLRRGAGDPRARPPGHPALARGQRGGHERGGERYRLYPSASLWGLVTTAKRPSR